VVRPKTVFPIEHHLIHQMGLLLMKLGVAGFILGAALPLAAQVSFVPAISGCSMAHCDTSINGLDHAVSPMVPTSTILSHDTLPAGKGNGLGCSSNGTIAACSYADPSGNNLVLYGPDGSRLWASGSLLDAQAFASAPMIDSAGDVIAADDQHMVRVSSSGNVVWDAPTTGGTPISPVITQSGALVLATLGGPVSAYSNVSGALIGAQYFRPEQGSSSYYETVNTPCVNGNRVYISTQLSSDPESGALLAVDVNASDPENPLTLAWQFSFGGPSGASPVCVGGDIFFDGTSLNPDSGYDPVIFGLQDTGSSASLLWVQDVPSPVPAALAVDPRGDGLWCIFLDDPWIERRSLATGSVDGAINIATLVGDPLPNNPYSEINIAGGSANPVMLLGTTSQPQLFYGKRRPDSIAFSSYVIAINLNTSSLLWEVNLSPFLGTDSAASQFAVITGASGSPEVVFAGNTSGAYFVGAP